MVVTDKFVYLHKPKTGGTFVTSVLLRLHDASWKTWHHFRLALAGRIRFDSPAGRLIMTSDKHGGCHQIPREFLGRPILSTLRHPLDYYVSQYEFGWWKRREWSKYFRQMDGFERDFPRFPELIFPDFLRLMVTAFNPGIHHEFENPEAYGPLTVEFIRFYFHRPELILSAENDRYFSDESYKEDLFPVHFLLTHRLNSGLYEYLYDMGYPEERLAFIPDLEKIRPGGKGRSEDQSWQKYYSPELRELMYGKDRILFRLFPEFE